MNKKKVGIRTSDRIAAQNKIRRMKESTASDLPEQSHRGEDPIKIRRMEKIDTHNIAYGKNHNDTKEVPLTDTCSQREYQEVLSGS